MRVLLLSHGLPPESLGGVEQHVQGLTKALVQLGCEVHIHARTSSPGRPQGEVIRERQGNPVVTRVVYRWEGVTSLDEVYQAPALEPALERQLNLAASAGKAFDVAHVHHLTGLSTGSLAVLRRHGLPVVLTLHDYWLLCPRGQMFHHREELCETVERQRCAGCLQATFPHWLAEGSGEAVDRLHARAREVLEAADRLVVPSARAIPPYAAFGIAPERFTVVENGVDTAALELLPATRADSGALRLGYLGALIPSKGLHVLVEAVQRQRPGTVTLDVFGNAAPYHGDEGYLTRVFGRLQPGDPVRYHGPYGTDQLPAILGNLDVVAAPALWREAFGLTPREALAAGRPVLTSRLGGLQDAVQDGVEGMVLPPGDVAAWAAAITGLARDRDRVRTMAARTRQRARGFRAMAEELLGIYRDLRRA